MRHVAKFEKLPTRTTLIRLTVFSLAPMALLLLALYFLVDAANRLALQQAKSREDDLLMAVDLPPLSVQLLPLGFYVTLIVLLISGLGILIYMLWTIWHYAKSIDRTAEQTRRRVYELVGPMRNPAVDNNLAEVAAWVDSLAGALRDAQVRLDRHTSHLQILHDISEQLNQELSPNSIVRVVVESIWRVADIDFVAVLLGEEELGPFHCAGIRGVPDPLAMLDQECQVPLWGVLAQALVNRPEAGKPDYLVIEDIEAEGHPRPGEFPWEIQPGCLMIIPMRHDHKTLGAILIGSHIPRYFADASLRHFLYAIAGSATRALQSVQSHQQSNRWIKQLVSLQVLTRTITRAQSLDKILEALDRELTDMFGDVTVRIFLREVPQGTETTALPRLRLYPAQALDRNERQMLWSSPVMRLVRWVMEAEQPLFFDPAAQLTAADDLYYRASGRGLLVPIGEEDALGVIFIAAPDRPTPFEESDMIVMRTIANSAAIAIGQCNCKDHIQTLPTVVAQA